MESYQVDFKPDPLLHETQMGALDRVLKNILRMERQAIDARYGVESDNTEVSDDPKCRLVGNYEYIGSTGFDPVVFPDIESLMVWKDKGKNGRELVHLQDWLYDLRSSRLKSKSGEREWRHLHKENVGGVDVFRTDLDNHMAETVKRLMEAGRIVLFPSQKNAPPKALCYDRANSSITALDIGSGEIRREAAKKPWFVGLGFFTNFVLAVSDSARKEKARYDNMQKMQEAYKGQEINQAILQVQKDNAIEREVTEIMKTGQYISEEMRLTPRMKRMENRLKKHTEFTQQQRDYLAANGGSVLRKDATQVKPKKEVVQEQEISLKTKAEEERKNEIEFKLFCVKEDIKDVTDEVIRENIINDYAETYKDWGETFLGALDKLRTIQKEPIQNEQVNDKESKTIDGKSKVESTEEKIPEEIEKEADISRMVDAWEEKLKHAATEEEKEDINKTYVGSLKELGVDYSAVRKEPENLCMEKLKESILISQIQEAKLESLFAPDRESDKLTADDMVAIGLCCTLSSPFTKGTDIADLLKKSNQKIKNNNCYISYSIFEDTQNGTLNQVHEGNVIADTAIKSGNILRMQVLEEYDKNKTAQLTRHIENGLVTMNRILQSASSEDFMNANDNVMMAAQGIKKTMDFLDKDKTVKFFLNMSDEELNVCRGWQQFANIHNDAIKAQETILSGKEYDPKAMQLAIAQDQNIRTICGNSVKKEVSTDVNQANYWEETRKRSNAILQTEPIPFIAEMGKDPKYADIAKLAPDWNPQGMQNDQIIQYIVEELPEQLTKLPIHQTEELLKSKPLPSPEKINLSPSVPKEPIQKEFKKKELSI